MEISGFDSSASTDSLLKSKIDELSRNSSLGQKKNLTDKEKADFAKASRGFESMFVNMMMKEMKNAMLDKDKPEDEELSFGADTLEGYTDMLYSDQISKTGTGIGIADMIYQNLTGERLSGITSYLPGSSLKDMQVEKNLAPTLSPSLSAKNTAKASDLGAKVSGNFIERVKDRLDKYDHIIKKANEATGVPEELIKAVITTESAGLNTAKSGAGAKGLMQLMDGTAKDLGVKNSYDPSQNILGGAKYLKQMLEKFDGNLNHALAAYNAGPGAVQKYGGVPPYSETQAYVKRVQKYLQIYQKDE